MFHRDRDISHRWPRRELSRSAIVRFNQTGIFARTQPVREETIEQNFGDDFGSIAPEQVTMNSYRKKLLLEEEEFDKRRDDFAAAHIVSEYYFPANSVCQVCQVNIATHLCRTCGDNVAKCSHCMYRKHLNLPPHQIQRYDAILGLCNDDPVLSYDLNCPPKDAYVPSICLNYLRTCSCDCVSFNRKKLLLVDVTASSQTVVSYCSCHSLAVALVRNGYYPNSMINPTVIFSRGLLEFYRQLLLKAKVSKHAFIEVLRGVHRAPWLPSSLTNNLALAYREYMIAAHNTESLEAFGLSHLFTTCPACVQPGQKGALHVAIDGNFSLCRRKNAGKIQIHTTTRQLQNYILPDTPDILARSSTVTDSGCPSKFKAGEAGRPPSMYHALDQTGLLGAFCARHGTPLCFIDMKAGERYIYPDLVCQKLFQRYTSNVAFLIYYDIACKYVPHLVRLDWAQGFQIVGAVPKFHVYAHGLSCLNQYHPSRVPGCGLTDGETCERAWSNLGKYYTIIKEMLPWNRWETIEDGLLDLWFMTLRSIIQSFKSRINKASRISAESQESLFYAKDEERYRAEQLRESRQVLPSSRPTVRFSTSLSPEEKVEYHEDTIRHSYRHVKVLENLRNSRFMPVGGKMAKCWAKRINRVYSQVKKALKDRLAVIDTAELTGARYAAITDVDLKNRNHPIWLLEDPERQIDDLDMGLIQEFADALDNVDRCVEEIEMINLEKQRLEAFLHSLVLEIEGCSVEDATELEPVIRDSYIIYRNTEASKWRAICQKIGSEPVRLLDNEEVDYSDAEEDRDQDEDVSD